jgi:regulator of protease activity HflC (stomatin/prohibitin superfamily)
MISTLIFLLCVAILGTVTGSFTPNNYKGEDGDFDPPNVKQIVKAGVTLILSIVIGVVQPIEVQRIDAGNVGLKIDRIGNSKGIPTARSCKGWVFYNSWTTDVVEYSIRQNHVGYNKFGVTTKGGFPLNVEPSFNYALKPDKAADLYINLLKGNDFKSLESNFLLTATNLSLNNASNKYPIDSIFNNKEGYNRAVADELNRELSAYFIVTQINPGTIAPPELAEVISAKTNAVQKAQQAELDRITAVAQAETKIATARGDSAALVIDAQAQAEAIKQKQREITPNYIEYVKWSTWDGKLPTTTLGGGTNVLLNK